MFTKRDTIYRFFVSLFVNRVLQILKSPAGFGRAFGGTESGKPEEAAARFTESFAGRSDYAVLGKEQVEELPATHVVRALEPDVR